MWVSRIGWLAVGLAAALLLHRTTETRATEEVDLHSLAPRTIERELIEVNPFDRVKAPVRTVQRERQLREDEIPVIWRAAEELGYPFGTASSTRPVRG